MTLDDVKQLEDELGRLRTENAELRMLMGLIEHEVSSERPVTWPQRVMRVRQHLAEFRKPADFPAHKNGEHR